MDKKQEVPRKRARKEEKKAFPEELTAGGKVQGHWRARHFHGPAG